ncbi:MAG: MBL fold metallo-hydrolase [Blautia sp.]|nr:MBL fold metallo-hydrolase [Blautia sp.]
MHKENAAAHSRLSVVPDLSSHGNGWKITQFGDVEGLQEMCYTISTDTGLAIIDGGWDYEVDRLRRIIASYGNSVDAWIITHPHNDHITAFLEIYKDPQGIAIHHVYTPQMPELSVLESNAGWDDYSLLEELLSLQIPQLEYLYTGDERNILGLKMKVLSACSEEIDSISNDLMNDGSMVFKLSGEKNSILFCSDAGSANGNEELSRKIISEFKKDLKSDYLQISHHGFGGLSDEFNDLVDARGVFFDSPAWHLTSTGKISSKENDLRMQKQGRIVYSFFTVPNQILLQ